MRCKRYVRGTFPEPGGATSAALTWILLPRCLGLSLRIAEARCDRVPHVALRPCPRTVVLGGVSRSPAPSGRTNRIHSRYVLVVSATRDASLGELRPSPASACAAACTSAMATRQPLIDI